MSNPATTQRGSLDSGDFAFGGATPARADARRNRDAVIEAARRAFAEQGVEASLEDIARDAGVGSATLHRHFPTREDLIASAIADGMKKTYDRGRELLASTGTSDTFFIWVSALALQFGTYAGLPESIHRTADEQKTALGLSCAAIRALNEHLIARAREEGSVRADVTGDEVFTFVNAVAWTHRGSEAAHADRALSLLFDGLRPR